MQVNIHQAKAKLSGLIEKAVSGEDVVLARGKKPVARIVPLSGAKRSRVGRLSGRPFRMGKNFDSPEKNQELADDFGVAGK